MGWMAAANAAPLWLVLVIWGICLLLGAWAGSVKGRPITGIILGLLLGPLGVAACLALPHAGNMRCPSCGKRTRWVRGTRAVARPARASPISGAPGVAKSVGMRLRP